MGGFISYLVPLSIVLCWMYWEHRLSPLAVGSPECKLQPDLREKAVHQTDSLDSEGDAVMEKNRYPLPWRGGDCNPVKRSRKKKHTFGFWPARVPGFVDTVGEPTQHLCSNSFSLPPSLLEAGQAKSHFHSLPSS